MPAAGSSASDSRKKQRHNAAPSRLALQRDVAAQLPYHSEHLAQAEAAPPANILGGEERLECLGGDVRRHAASRVAYRHRNKCARLSLRSVFEILVAQRDVAGRDR